MRSVEKRAQVAGTRSHDLTLLVPPVASAHVSSALAHFRYELPGIEVVAARGELRVLDADGKEPERIRDAWDTAIFGEHVLERSADFRKRVLGRLFGP